MPYNYRFAPSKDPAKRKHRLMISFLVFLLLVVACGIIIFIWYVTRAGSDDQPQSDIRSNSFNPLKTFDTPYFSFETDKSWSFISKESSNDTFVYRSSRNNVVMRDMTVFVNTLPPNLLLTYVLPVEADGNRFIPGNVSDHCKEYLKDRIKPGDNNPIDADVASVRIKCQVDGTSATVGTGLKNGSYQVSLSGKGGRTNKYYLLYHDLQYTPNLDTFTTIVRSFQAK